MFRSFSLYTHVRSYVMSLMEGNKAVYTLLFSIYFAKACARINICNNRS